MDFFLNFQSFLLLLYVLEGNAYKLEIKAQHRRSAKANVNPMDYLFTYGYFPGFCSSKTCELKKENKETMIKEYQSFANLQVTGQIDDATIRQMHIPRCSNKDKKYPGFTGRRQKRYNPQGTVWEKVKKRGAPLTWRYGKPNPSAPNEGITQDMSRDAVIRILKEAMKKWSDVAKITFQEDNISEPDIWIFFGTRSHGDPFPFDGPSGTLAHAFYPLNNQGTAGDMHFDDDERFTEKSDQGRNLMWVATHELGHSLGLAHSNVKDAVMYPYYHGYRPNFKLQDDDIRGIQSIYGKVPTKQVKQSCPRGITAIWLGTMPTHRVITTASEVYTYDMSGNVNKPTTPSSLADVDAAFTGKIYSDSNEEFTVLFTGETYSVYTKDLVLKSSGHSIHQLRNENGERNPLQLDFPTNVKQIHATVKWQRNGKLYMFYRHNGVGYYRRYNLEKQRFYRSRRTRKVDWNTAKRWKGLPTQGPDAAVSCKRRGTYFVTGNNVYGFDDRSVRVRAGYPKPIGSGGFLQCEQNK